MSDENVEQNQETEVHEAIEVETYSEEHPAPEKVEQEVKDTSPYAELKEKFEALVVKLADHGIHVG